MGYIGVISGLYRGYIGVIWGLYTAAKAKAKGSSRTKAGSPKLWEEDASPSPRAKRAPRKDAREARANETPNRQKPWTREEDAWSAASFRSCRLWVFSFEAVAALAWQAPHVLTQEAPFAADREPSPARGSWAPTKCGEPCSTPCRTMQKLTC